MRLILLKKVVMLLSQYQGTMKKTTRMTTLCEDIGYRYRYRCWDITKAIYQVCFKIRERNRIMSIYLKASSKLMVARYGLKTMLMEKELLFILVLLRQKQIKSTLMNLGYIDLSTIHLNELLLLWKETKRQITKTSCP